MKNVESVATGFERLPSRQSPASISYRTVGGCGSGRICSGCGAVIPNNRMEIEVEYAPGSGMDSLVLHVNCFAAWLGTAGGSALW